MILRLEKYKVALRNIPPSGGGGCHAALLGVANLGRLAGFSREQIAQDLAAYVHGTRKITDAEILAAVHKAFDSNTPFVGMRRATSRATVDGAKLLKGILELGDPIDEAELWEQSPVRFDRKPNHDSVEILQQLYGPEEKLFLGARHEAGVESVRTASDWIARIKRGIVPEHIIPNPLTGELGKTKEGKPSYRADSCVMKFRFAVVEFDGMPRETQIHFWGGVKLPIVALIDSGGKSVHAWVRIDAANADEWAERVEGKLFDLLRLVGADGSCKNEARLSRLPGHFRAEKKHWQRLLYLNPAGGTIQ